MSNDGPNGVNNQQNRIKGVLEFDPKGEFAKRIPKNGNDSVIGTIYNPGVDQSTIVTNNRGYVPASNDSVSNFMGFVSRGGISKESYEAILQKSDQGHLQEGDLEKITFVAKQKGKQRIDQILLRGGGLTQLRSEYLILKSRVA